MSLGVPQKSKKQETNRHKFSLDCSMLFTKNDLYEDTTVQNDTEKGETYECCCEQAKFQKMKTEYEQTNSWLML